MKKIVSPLFVSEFKYIFGRIREGLKGKVRYIYLVKQKNFYAKILDLFVSEGFIKGYREFGEMLVVYFRTDNPVALAGRFGSVAGIKNVRWLRRRPSIRVRDLQR
jgi:hypothetical protein